MQVADLNWMQLEDYLSGDDRIVLPLGCTEQHAYLSLATDNILAERVAVEAAEPLGVPVLPVLAYGITPSFAAFPGSPSLRLDTFASLIRDLLDSLYGQGFRRHDWWSSPRVQEVARGIDPGRRLAQWPFRLAPGPRPVIADGRTGGARTS